MDFFAVAEEAGGEGGVGMAFEEPGEHGFAVVFGVKEGCLAAEGDEVGGPDGVGVDGAGDAVGAGVDVEAAVEEFAGELGAVVFDGHVEEGGAGEGVVAVFDVEGLPEAVGVGIEPGAEAFEGVEVNGDDAVGGIGGAGVEEEVDAAGFEWRAVVGGEEVFEGVAGAVDAGDGSGGVGLVTEEVGDAFGVEVFAGGEEDGAVEGVEDAVGVGAEFEEGVGGFELAEGGGLGEGAVALAFGGVGAEFAQAFEVAGGGGVKEGGIGGLHGDAVQGERGNGKGVIGLQSAGKFGKGWV